MEDQSPDLRELLWRRKLSKVERSELRAQPELEFGGFQLVGAWLKV